MNGTNADRAIIAADKLTGYLLNVSHKRGGPKTRLLLSIGYRADTPKRWSRTSAPSTFARCDPHAPERLRRRLRD